MSLSGRYGHVQKATNAKGTAPTTFPSSRALGVASFAVCTFLVLVASIWLGVIPLVRTPAYESLRLHPDSSVSGVLAYVASGPDGSDCVWTLVTSGESEPRSIRCDVKPDAEVAFTRNGEVVIADQKHASHAGTAFVRVFNANAEMISSFDAPLDANNKALQADLGPSLYGDTPALTKYSGGYSPITPWNGPHHAWLATDGDGHKRIVQRWAPGDYQYTAGIESPDSQWILICDNKNNLIVSDRRNNIRLLDSPSSYKNAASFNWSFCISRPVSNGAWFQTGLTRGTVDIDALRRAATGGTFTATDPAVSQAFSDVLPRQSGSNTFL